MSTDQALVLDSSTNVTCGRSIRREHECTHHFTLRVFGKLQHNLIEEVIADSVGLAAGDGGYEEELALRFLGLEACPAYREGGRLEALFD